MQLAFLERVVSFCWNFLNYFEIKTEKNRHES